MEPRVCGLETEYGLALETNDRRLMSADFGTAYNRVEQGLLARFLTLESDSFGRSPGERGGGIEIREGRFLESGARCYYDTGHIEWATPETTSAQEAVRYELAGERTLFELARATSMPGGNRLLLIKNNVDYIHGRTYGCHENYQIRRRAGGDAEFFTWLARRLLAFLVTRQIFCGAGRVGSADPNARGQVAYQISQRADFIAQITSGDTRADRAIINVRDESLGDARYFRRLHLIVGDSTMSPLAGLLKLGTTRIVLGLIEAGVLEEVPQLADPVGALKAISRDLSCHADVVLQDGRALNPIEIQRIYLRQAQGYFGQQRPDQPTQQILELWGQMIDDLDSDPLRLADRVDWVSKYVYLLDRQRTQIGTSWDQVMAWSAVFDAAHARQAAGVAPAALQATLRQEIVNRGLGQADMAVQRRLYFDLRERDLRYHDVDPQRSLFYALQRAGLVSRMFDPASLEHAQLHPPTDTRAVLRAKVIRWAHTHGREAHTLLDWNRVEFAEPRATMTLANPLAIRQPELDRYLEEHRLRPDQEPDLDDLIRILGEETLTPPEPPTGGLRHWFRRLFGASD